MSFGDTALLGGLSYVALGRETTAGTYNTCTAGLDFLSFGLVTTQENKILEQVERSRTYSKRIQQSKNIAGPVSFYYAPEVLACNYILQNAMTATITTATGASDTTGSEAYEHTFSIGNVDQSHPSMCINARKGPVTNGRVFQYGGVKVNDITFTANIDEPLQVDANLIAMDSTQVANDVESALTVTCAQVLSFDGGRLSVEQSFGSLTSSSFWHVQSAEWGWNNNLKADAAAGRIGSFTKEILPLGVVQFNMKATVRFNTTTAYDAMIGASALAMQLKFEGETISTSIFRKSIRFDFPKVYITNAGDPVVNGPNEILTSDVEFHVLRDCSSATGYAMKAIVMNTTSSFA